MNDSGSNPNKFPRYSGEADPDLEVIDVHTNHPAVRTVRNITLFLRLHTTRGD